MNDVLALITAGQGATTGIAILARPWIQENVDLNFPYSEFVGQTELILSLHYLK